MLSYSHIPPFDTPFSDNPMHYPPIENLDLQPRERPPVPVEGTRLESDETNGRQRVAEGTTGRRRSIIDTQRAEISRLSSWKERYARKYRLAKERIADLDQQLEERSRAHNQAVAKRDQRIQKLEGELARTNELLAARSKELSAAQPFLSTTDRKSEADVLGIVRSLNENIFQIAANLTEEWEKLRSSRRDRFEPSKEDMNTLSQSLGSALVYKARYRIPVGLTFLIQTCLCDFATCITSSWTNNKELSILGSVYQHLSASEGQAISARWRSLTHSHLSDPPLHSDSIAEHLGRIMQITGLFPSFKESVGFVRAKAFTGIQTIERLAMDLETVFMVDITSSDMCLLYEAPSTPFDDTRMTKECKPERASASKRPDKVVGTTEVGVGKSVAGKQDESRHTQILLKSTVVLEKDIVGL